MQICNSSLQEIIKVELRLVTRNAHIVLPDVQILSGTLSIWGSKNGPWESINDVQDDFIVKQAFDGATQVTSFEFVAICGDDWDDNDAPTAVQSNHSMATELLGVWIRENYQVLFKYHFKKWKLCLHCLGRATEVKANQHVPHALKLFDESDI